ncbi:MAG: cytidylate kinase family protein [Candidatus Aenigmarchaeota archaeon]|nr:cytidylate kinase family protein [Candidatus Aenigmarchaeota archaeon]
MVVIAVSGLPGSGSSTLSKLLAEKLNLKYFSPGEYFKDHSNKNNQTSKALDVFKSGKGKEKNFHESIDEMQKRLAKKGNIVICGKLSILMLKDIADYKIWLDCAIKERAKRTAQRDGISYKEALKALKEREKLEVEEWKKDYGIDYRKQKEMADLVIDTSNMSEKEVLEKVLNFIKI